MSHLKLFFPGLSTSSAFCILTAHSALASLSLGSQDQNQDSHQDNSLEKTSTFRPVPFRWKPISPAIFKQSYPRMIEKTLTCVHDPQNHDFPEGEQAGLVHSLQLQTEEYRFNDIETVKSQQESQSRSRKQSISSQTESIECLESLIVDIK